MARFCWNRMSEATAEDHRQHRAIIKRSIEVSCEFIEEIDWSSSKRKRLSAVLQLRSKNGREIPSLFGHALCHYRNTK